MSEPRQVERRRLTDDESAWRASVNERLQVGDTRMATIEDEVKDLKTAVDENTEVSKSTKGDTAEILEFMTTLKSLLKFGNALSSVAIKIWKPLSYIAATLSAVAVAWAAWRGSGK